MGAGEPQDQEVRGCGCPRAEPTHGCRLAFTRALGPFRGQRPRVQAREGQAASLGALPNAFTMHCVLSLCWPSMTRAPASPSTPPSLASALWGHLAGSQERWQSQAGALRSGSAASPGKPHSYPWLCTCPSLCLLFARLVPSRRWSQLHRDTLLALLEPSSGPCVLSFMELRTINSSFFKKFVCFLDYYLSSPTDDTPWELGPLPSSPPPTHTMHSESLLNERVSQ